MLAHPTFPEITLHSDAELGLALGDAVAKRRTIHEWPLSCVQAVTLGDGRVIVYKSQLPPTVEPQFYQCSSSSLLAGHHVLGSVGRCQTLVTDWVDAPTLDAVPATDDEVAAQTRCVISHIAEIQGDPPVYLDIGTPEHWLSACEVALGRLSVLVQEGSFLRIPSQAVAALRHWTQRDDILSATIGSQITHADLRADHIFVTRSGFRVIDWQRPVRTLPDVDLVSVLIDRRIEPSRYATRQAIEIYWFLRLYWALEAKTVLLPALPGPLFENWTRQALAGILRP